MMKIKSSIGSLASVFIWANICLGDKAEYPRVMDPWEENPQLVASDKKADDNLGYSIAVSGDGRIVVAGAPQADIGGTNNAGAVYVFTNSIFGWSGLSNECAKLFASDRQADDHFGSAVAISADGSVIVVGAPDADSDGYNSSGKAYVFKAVDGAWTTVSNESARLFAADPTSSDQLGISVAISEDKTTIVAGAHYANIGETDSCGAVYLFENSGDNWTGNLTNSAKLFASDFKPGDYVGYSVALSSNGHLVAAGAPGYNHLSNEDTGAIYVFANGGGAWSEISNECAKLRFLVLTEFDHTGQSVAMSADGRVIAAGAYTASPDEVGTAGAVYLFTNDLWSGDTLQRCELKASDKASGDRLGTSLAMSADGLKVASGARYATITVPIWSAGAVYVFTNADRNWAFWETEESAKLHASDGQTNDYLGFSAAMTPDGATIVAGAYQANPGGSNNAGAAYVFAIPPPTPAGAIGLHPASLLNNVTYGDQPDEEVFTITNSGWVVYDWTNTIAYSSGANGWFSPSWLTGRLEVAAYVVITGVIDIAGMNAGTYYATNTFSSDTATNSPQSLVVTLNILKKPQTITFPTIYDQLITNHIGLAATSSSGLEVSYEVTQGPAVLDGTNVTFNGTGTVSIVASQSGNANYAAAESRTETFDVHKVPQTITFPQIFDQKATNIIGLAAVASSGLEVSYEVVSGPGVLDSTNLSFSGGGIVGVAALQSGNETWAPAGETNTFDVYYFSAYSGPFWGGNTIIISNGFFGDITNVLVAWSPATILDSGTNWVEIELPPMLFSGEAPVIIQTSDHGDISPSFKYWVNPKGMIFNNNPKGWTEVEGLPAARYGLAGASAGSCFYAMGGWNGESSHTNAYRFDGTHWQEVAGLPSPRWLAGAGTLFGTLHAAGGYDSYPRTNLWRYRDINWPWSEYQGLPMPCDKMLMASLGYDMYSIGGATTGDTVITNVYRFDGSSWTEVAGLPAPRAAMAGGTLGGYIYVVGGINAASMSQTNVFRFDGTNWTEVAGLPQTRRNLSCGVIGEFLFAAGGYRSSASTNVYRFDGSVWTEVEGLPAGRWMHAGGALDDQLFVVGGDNGSFVAQTNVFRYSLGTVGVAPAAGTLGGGYEVVISGLNLNDGSDVTNVTLCGVPAEIQDISATQIVVVAGVSVAPVTGDVRVCSVSFGETVKSLGFIYQPPAFITNNTPVPVPVEWMAEYGLTNNMDEEVADDPDSDIALTWQEYVMDTNPTNSSSVLKLDNLKWADGQLLLWTASSARVYAIYWSHDLPEGVTNLLFGPFTPDESGGISYTDSVQSLQNRAYYRVHVTLPD